MSPVARCLDELGAHLRVRGRRRRRILAECAEHLREAAVAQGEDAAVASFGPPAEIAHALDLEAAASRAGASTAWSCAAVVLTGFSTLVLINAADDVTPSLAPVLVFLVAAQLAATAAASALLQAIAQRRRASQAAALALLARRNAVAVASAGLAMLAAGAALSGRGSAPLLLAGPAALVVALFSLLGTRRLIRALPGALERAVDSPLEDLGAVVGAGVVAPLRAFDPLRHAVRSAVVVATVAAAAVFARQVGEGSAPGAAGALAAFEAAAVVGSFGLLGPMLGLRRAC